MFFFLQKLDHLLTLFFTSVKTNHREIFAGCKIPFNALAAIFRMHHKYYTNLQYVNGGKQFKKKYISNREQVCPNVLWILLL